MGDGYRNECIECIKINQSKHLIAYDQSIQDMHKKDLLEIYPSKIKDNLKIKFDNIRKELIQEQKILDKFKNDIDEIGINEISIIADVYNRMRFQ